MAGQSIGDRLVAAQHTILGSETAKIVCKASTSEATPPKKKHLDYLLAMTNEPNVNIPELANHLVDRTRQLKWIVVFKALTTTHHLMCNGNERFLQHLASRNGLFSLSTFLDKTGTQSYEMSGYLRRYSVYLNQKALSYRAVAYDFCRVKRGKDGFIRTLDTDELLKVLPVVQQQLDCLIDFDASSRSLNNGIIIAAFMLLFKDLIRLFACYNDGIINLLEKYFDMKKNQCKEAIDIYKKFIIRMNKVPEMLKVAEQVGVDKGDIPNLTNAPNSLLESLEQHFASLDNKKIDHKYSSAAASSQISTLKTINSSLFKVEQHTPDLVFDDDKFDMKSASTPKADFIQQATTPHQQVFQEPSPKSENLLNIFGGTPSTSSPTTTLVGNPFSQSFSPAVTTASPIQQLQTSPQQPLFGMGIQQSFQQQQMPLFSSSPQSQPPLDLFNVQQEKSTFSGPSFTDSTFASTDLLQPLKSEQQALSPQSSKDFSQAANNIISLESSLADLQASLKGGKQKANTDFQPKEKKLTGGSNFNPSSYTSLSAFTANPITTMGMPMNSQQTTFFGSAPMSAQPMVAQQQQPLQNSAGRMPFQQPNPQAPQSRPLNPNNPFL